MRRIMAWLAAAVMGLGLLAGCKGETKPSEESSADYPVYVSNIKLDQAPTRVAVFSPSLAEVICDMQFGAALFGRVDECDWPESVAELPSAGSLYDPDIETVMRWKPQLVLFDAEPKGELASALYDAGLTVLVVSPAENFGQLKTLYRTIGKIFAGNDKGAVQGDALFQKLEGRLEELANKLKTAKEPPPALIVTDTFGHVVTGDTVPQRLFDACGAVNTASKGSGWTAAAEDIAVTEVLFCPKGQADKIKALPALQTCPAVQSNAIYEIDVIAMERQGLRFAALAEDMAKQLHPGAFTGAAGSQNQSGGSEPQSSEDTASS